MKTSSEGVIARPDRAAVMAMAKRDRIYRSMLLLRHAGSEMDLGLRLARDGFHVAARECFRQARMALGRAHRRLDVLFSEDWRAQ